MNKLIPGYENDKPGSKHEIVINELDGCAITKHRSTHPRRIVIVFADEVAQDGGVVDIIGLLERHSHHVAHLGG